MHGLRIFLWVFLAVTISACAPKPDVTPIQKEVSNAHITQAIIYSAQTILTSNPARPSVQAVTVQDGHIVAVGNVAELKSQFPNAVHDTRFENKTIVPGLIDPHIHMILGAMMYAKPFAPPWDVQTPTGTVKGLPDRVSFLARIVRIEQENTGTKPLIIYGYHNLVHGQLDRHDLDKITTDRPLIIWHYSGHDFYLNSQALKYVGVDASWAQEFEGVPLGDDGQPTGRVYEDAVFKFLTKTGALFLGPTDIMRGFNGLEDMFAHNGVTTVAENGTQNGQRLILEHAGLMRPEQITRAGELGAGMSVASHYVHYMGKTYEQAIGERVKYMTPLASSFKVGLPTTMHSDAPLAPPSPLTTAASVHMLRSTREGGVSTPYEKLTPTQALRAITIDAAWSLGLEDEIGSIEIGKRADFTILGANPLDTLAEDWPSIKIWGVVLDGALKPLQEK